MVAEREFGGRLAKTVQQGASRPAIPLGRRIFYLIVLLVSVPIIYFFVFRGMRFFKVPSNSMEPTILVSDYLLTLEAESYGRGDIVVLKDPMVIGGYIVKRIVAVGGDAIEIRGGAVFLNKEYASEPYRMDPIDYLMPSYAVEPGHVFVMGDNSNWSVDSHNWNEGAEDETEYRPGSVAADSIVGKVVWVYLPVGRAHRVDSFPLTDLTGI